MAALLRPVPVDTPDAILVSWEEWPLLTVRWSAGRKSAEAVRAFCDAIREAVTLDEEFSALVDSRGAWPMTPSQLADVLGVISDVQRRARCRALALVSPSPVHRATLDSVRWLHVSPQLWGCFDDESSARAWLAK